jgi:multidrug efflux pump subunit AcrB
MVRYTENERHNLGSIKNMRIRTPNGEAIPLHEVAQVQQGRGYSTIHRIDRLRTISVTADVDEAVANAKKIIGDLQSEFLPRLENKYPNVKIAFGGQEESTQETISGLARGFSIAILAVFCLLATQFRSYVQPLIVMTAIPFGMIGAIMGHLLFGQPFTIMSLFGIVALAGIVVNDALVLIDFINQSLRAPDGSRRRYVSVFQAAFDAGKKRFRAVLLTTVTTFAGLFPILMETSFQALFLKPMVVSITFGLLFATVLTLFLIPSLYMILDDVLTAIKPKQQ